MRHNDYSISGGCKLCGKLHFSPVLWTSKDTSRPSYPTCSHVLAEPRQQPKDYSKPRYLRVANETKPQEFTSFNYKNHIPITMFEQLMTKNDGVAVIETLRRHKLNFRTTTRLPFFTFISDE